jgi:CHAT domain-containing protein
MVSRIEHFGGARTKLARQFLVPVLVFIGVYLAGSAAYPQVGERQAPSPTYYLIFREFYAGNYKGALEGFQSEARSCIKAGQSRWIDSICYETMIGECFYQTGILDKALEHYNMALELAAMFPDWMVRMQFQPIRAAGQRRPYPWGASVRRSVLANLPQTQLIGQGQVNNTQTYTQGGVVQQALFYAVSPQEIIRCTALAIRRRAEILGPISKNDPLTERIAGIFSRQMTVPNHWSEAWADLERGLALIAAGRENQGLPSLQRALAAQGEFDHPLTCIALLEIGRLSLARSDYTTALQSFEEATFSAADYADYGVLEEAFKYAAITRLITDRKGFYAPLQGAMQWAKTKDLRQLRASLALSAAENYATLDQVKDAVVMLDEARICLSQRRATPIGRLGGRLSYLSAGVWFQQKNIQKGQADLTAAMSYMKQGSLRLFQIALADALYASGKASARDAMDYYSALLRDPSPSDWLIDPMETLATLVNPHTASMEHWFTIAMERKDYEAAWEISDRARRHRFYSTLEMGGRLQSLRWILESPAESLDQQTSLQRQDLLSHWPQYKRVADEARAIRAKLADIPLATDDQTQRKEQAKALGELALMSGQQETMLREIALRREPAAMLFPPQRSIAEIKKSLPKGHAILAFFAADRRLYGVLIGTSDYSSWEVTAYQTLAKQVKDYLHDLGQYQPNHELSLKDLDDAKWKQSGSKTLDALLKGSRADFSTHFEELIIVPDGITWYVPFDALPVTVNGQLHSLISRFRIHYAPTISLATSAQPRRTKPAGNTAVVLGKLYAREDESVVKAAFEQLAAALPGTVALKSPAPGAIADYKLVFDRLLVLDDLTTNEQEPYGWTPAPLDKSRAGGTLADWMELPWGGPEQIVLPGFHTAAEDAMKKPSRNAPGEEVFLSACGLMSSGARTVLLSRWRTGGQSSLDLAREFTQELPHATPAEAWQRAVLLETGTQLNLDAEPRIKHAAADEKAPKADNPFFWAGYMLFDSTQISQQAEPKSAEPPKLKLPEPAQAKPAEPEKPQENVKKEKQPKKK